MDNWDVETMKDRWTMRMNKRRDRLTPTSPSYLRLQTQGWSKVRGLHRRLGWLVNHSYRDRPYQSPGGCGPWRESSSEPVSLGSSFVPLTVNYLSGPIPVRDGLSPGFTLVVKSCTVPDSVNSENRRGPFIQVCETSRRPPTFGSKVVSRVRSRSSEKRRPFGKDHGRAFVS